MAISAESTPSTGELLDGRYLLETQAGVGGMGVVYRARDERLGRTVAVKIFRDAAADPARAESETRLLASLHHSALVTLFDAQTDAGRQNYLVMEYVDGPTLGAQIAGGPLPTVDVVAMTRDLAEALHVVHQAGIVHRDIKPSNVLLTRSRIPTEGYRAKLADFGIAYLIDSTRLTMPGTLIGTAAYLSPEQVRGGEPAPASDVYALGLVMLESLTGRRAFAQQGTHEAALARLTQDPAVPSSLGHAWVSLLTAMTARDPGRRPSALDVVLAAGQLGDAAPAPTELIEPAASAVREPPSTEAMEPVSTEAMEPSPREQSTLLLPGVGADTSVVASEATTAAITPATTPSRRALPSKRTLVILAVFALIVIAVTIALIVWALGSGGADVPPQLPVLDEPLGVHMQELLDSVTP